MELFAAVVVNLIATVLKFGDRTQLGATHLATSLVASFQLLAASLVWVWQLYVVGAPMDGEMTAVVVSLSGGALLANIFSVILLIGETLRQGASPRVARDRAMSDILFLILRRLRAPLITLILVYAISVGGLALIPGRRRPTANRGR